MPGNDTAEAGIETVEILLFTENPAENTPIPIRGLSAVCPRLVGVDFMNFSHAGKNNGP
ncbi:MAG: hypothetical protein ACE5LF_00430 [Alphaproteobacteria bacterium]